MSTDRKKIEFVYAAGPLTPRGIKSTNAAIEYLYNLKDLARTQIDLIMAGFTPYPTGLDFVYFLALKDGERITAPVIKKVSKNWLSRSDAILMTKFWEKSSGSIAEKELAEKLGLPVFYSIQEILDYNAGLDQPQLPLN